MNAPRTSREALIAEMLGDLDTLLDRMEALPQVVAAAEEKLAATITVLNQAGDKYRMAVTVFNEHAKTDLAEYLDRTAVEISSKTVEEQRAAIQEAARMAFRSEASDKAANLARALSEAAQDFRQSVWSRLIEHTVTALIASGFTAGLVYAMLK